MIDMEFSRIGRMIIGIMLLGLASAANAIPTLTFGGSLNYTASNSQLSLNGTLFSSQSIFPAPNFLSSSIQLTTTLTSTFSGSGLTIGTFGNGTVSISDSSGSLLTGAFNLAQMGGLNGGNQGALSLIFAPTGGSLMSYFSNPSDLFALTLNLTSAFGANMFNSNFTGSGNGNITSRSTPTTTVSEPGLVSLLIVGLGLLGVSGWHRRTVSAVSNRQV
jgi:hypothetical protein